MGAMPDTDLLINGGLSLFLYVRKCYNQILIYIYMIIISFSLVVYGGYNIGDKP